MASAARDRSSRWSTLLALISERGRLGVAEAAGELSVSEATIRRDFTDLAREQLVTRTHGGVVASSVAYELPARYRGDDQALARIAARAADLVPAGGVVGFNGGRTTTAVAREIGRRADEGGVTVVTNALNIATELVLRPPVRCLCLGGMARPESYELTGPLAHSVMEQLWLAVAVLGVNGLSAAGGASCRHEDEAGISALMAQRADRVVVVTTGDKVGRTSFARFVTAAEVDVLVTDDRADAGELERLADAGVDVVLA